MTVRVRIRTEGFEKVERRFEEAAQALSDYRPVLRKIRNQMWEDEREIFSTGQSTWDPWTEMYAAWRASHDRSRGFGMSMGGVGPLLDLTGTMFRSLTGPGPGNIAIVNRKSLSFGSTDRKIPYHREGVDPMGGWAAGAVLPVRDPTEFTRAMKQRWYRMMVDYVQSKLP